jgi:hypothetical protein
LFRLQEWLSILDDDFCRNFNYIVNVNLFRLQEWLSIFDDDFCRNFNYIVNVNLFRLQEWLSIFDDDFCRNFNYIVNVNLFRLQEWLSIFDDDFCRNFNYVQNILHFYTSFGWFFNKNLSGKFHKLQKHRFIFPLLIRIFLSLFLTFNRNFHGNLNNIIEWLLDDNFFFDVNYSLYILLNWNLSIDDDFFFNEDWGLYKDKMLYYHLFYNSLSW